MMSPLKQPWSGVQTEINDLLAHVEPQAFLDTLDCFEDRRRRWFFSGQGRSGLVAQMAAMRFMHLGFATHVVGEATAPAVSRGDALLLICGSGRTPVSVGFATIAKAQGAALVLVTRQAGGELADMADVTLTVPASNTDQFGGTLFEQGALILLDTIAFYLAGPDRADAHARMWQRHTNMQ